MIETTSLLHAEPDILSTSDGHMQSAQAKWSRLTQDDLSAVRTQADLVAKVEQRYSLPHGVAAQDVELWIKATARP